MTKRGNSQTQPFFKMIPVIAFMLFCFFGCDKDPFTPRGALKTVEGTVFEDCQGNVAQSRKIYFYYTLTGCFGSSVLSKDSTLTDKDGHFAFHYIAHEEDEYEGSTDSYAHTLTIPNSSISLYNPEGHFDLFPNETKMNAVIHLKFPQPYTSSDTFYFQYRPTPNGFVHEPELIQFFTGPFHDTTIVLNNLTIGNSNSKDHGEFHSGIFKWAIGIRRLKSSHTGHDGRFNLTHEPCAPVDVFEYEANPI